MTDPARTYGLTEGWPDESGKSEVEAFARALAAGVPELPAEALARAGERMREELRHQTRRRWRNRTVLAGALAASITVAFVIVRSLVDQPPTPGAKHAPPDRAPPAIVAADPPVRDTFRVPVLVTPAAPTPDRPLVPLDAHQGLFAN